MRENSKAGYLRWFASLMVVASFVVEMSSAGEPSVEPSAAEARKVAARVNGEPIYEDQLKPLVEKSLAVFRRYGMRKEDPDLVKRQQATVLDQMIGEMLINQESKKRTVENIDEKVEQRVKELEKKFGAGEGMDRYFKIRKTTPDQLRESLKARVRIDEYLKEQGVLDPEIPEDRIRKMYDEDPQSFSSRESVRVSQILIAVDPHAGPEAKEQARQKAEQIRQEILAGQDFAEMAKKHSNSKSASAGGDLGRPIQKGDLPPELEKVAFTLEAGAVSELIDEKFGWHILKVSEKLPARVVPYEQMRAFLKKYLQEEESKKKLAEHIATLKKNSKIEILLK